MKYLTDAERQIRPARIAAEYPYWLTCTIPVTGERPFIRWFRSAEDRDRYAADLPTTVTITAKGDPI